MHLSTTLGSMSIKQELGNASPLELT